MQHAKRYMLHNHVRVVKVEETFHQSTTRPNSRSLHCIDSLLLRFQPRKTAKGINVAIVESQQF